MTLVPIPRRDGATFGRRPAGTGNAVCRTWFEDDGPSPCPEDNVFFLLYPSRDAADRITALPARLRDGDYVPDRPTRRELLHVSLHAAGCFGRLTEGALAAIRRAAAGVTMPPFLAAFDRLLNFGRETGPLVLCGDEGVTGIAMLCNELVAATAGIIRPLATRPLTPHVTLDYGKCRMPERAVPEIRWTVDELVLVCSLRGRRRHRVLGRWRLRPTAPAP